MAEFKVDDRVAVYEKAERLTGVIQFPLGPIEEGLLYVVTDQRTRGHYSIVCHPKQCRRLVKKQRRRVWLTEITYANLVGGLQPHNATLEFIEVRKKK